MEKLTLSGQGMYLTRHTFEFPEGSQIIVKPFISEDRDNFIGWTLTEIISKRVVDTDEHEEIFDTKDFEF